MISCNIGPKNRFIRGTIGILANFLTILFASELSPVLFWSGIILSYAILLQGIIGICYLHALFRTTDMN